MGHGVSSVRTPGAAGEATTARTTARVRTRARIPSEGPLGYNDGERRAGAMNRHGLAGVQFFETSPGLGWLGLKCRWFLWEVKRSGELPKPGFIQCHLNKHSTVEYLTLV